MDRNNIDKNISIKNTNIITLRGHHIASISDQKKKPFRFYRKTIKIYGMESSKKIRDVVSKIDDDTDILLVKGLDDICDRCTFKEYCETSNFAGLNKAMLDNYPKEDTKGYNTLKLILKDEGSINPLSEDSFLIKELGLERDKTYKWGFLQKKYSEYMEDLLISLDPSRRRTNNESN